MGDLFDYLMNGRAEKSEGAESLRQMGVQAAQAFIRDGVPLTDSVARMAKQASLSEEKVRRVVEFANNSANSEKLRQPYDRNISFPLADVGAVLQQMQGGSVKVASAARPVLREIKPYTAARDYFSIEAYFAGHSKTASARALEKLAAPTEFSHVDEYGDVRDTAGAVRAYRRASEQHSDAKTELVVAEQNFLAKLATLSRVTYQAVAAGESPETIGAAVQTANPSAELFAVVQTELGDSMRQTSLQKLAADGMSVDPQNPITGLIQDLMNLSQKLVAADEMVQQTKGPVDQLIEFLQGPPQTNPTDQLFADEAPNLAMQQMVQQQQQAAAQQQAQQQQAAPQQAPQGPPGR